MYQHLLVPTDGSELSTLTVGAAVAFAKDAGARVTFFYAAPDFLATDDGALLRSIAPGLVGEHIAGDAHVILMKAESAARAAGVIHRSLYKVSERAHEAIVQTAQEQECDLIFMASRGPKSIGGLLLGSVTLKVLMHSPIPVLVSSVERNSLTPDADKAIGIIQDEHRSLAAILHGMRHVLKQAGDTPPNFALLRQMLHYIREFPERLHHPKEDTYLFSTLRARTGTVNQTLDILDAEHKDSLPLQQLEAALALFEQQGAAGGDAFAAALERYTEAQWRHMSLEEHTVLPAAKAHLLPQDWAALSDAFGKNGDPRFGANPDSEFRDLFAKLARLAQPLEQA